MRSSARVIWRLNLRKGSFPFPHLDGLEENTGAGALCEKVGRKLPGLRGGVCMRGDA